MCIFGVSNFVRYQVGAMNNSKVFFTGWFVIAVVCVAEVLLKLWNDGRVWLKGIAVLLLIEMSAASVCCFVHTILNKIVLFEGKGIEYANWVIENVPKEAVAITDLYGFSPFSVLAGRMSFLSFVGWPISQGIDVSERVNLTKRFVKGNVRGSIFESLGISYAEKYREEVLNLSRYNWNWTEVFCNDDYTLWEFIPYGL
jgi:hypothetical protein